MSIHTRLSCGAGVAAAAAVLLAGPSAASATRATVNAKAMPQNAPIGAPLTLVVNASASPDLPGQAMTLTAADVRFPDHVTINRRWFPVCRAATITAARGRFTNCPAGSRIGGGSFRADVPAAGVSDVPGRITIFNGGDGVVTVHVLSMNPVRVNEAFESRLVRTSGRFGYRLNIEIPYRLQEISPGWFVEMRKLNFSVGAKTMVKGRTRGLIEAERWTDTMPFAVRFSFLRESAPVTVNGLLDWK